MTTVETRNDALLQHDVEFTVTFHPTCSTRELTGTTAIINIAQAQAQAREERSKSKDSETDQN